MRQKNKIQNLQGKEVKTKMKSVRHFFTETDFQNKGNDMRDIRHSMPYQNKGNNMMEVLS